MSEPTKYNIAIIPAKAESDRCPGKNFRYIGDKPLFEYSVIYAVKEGFIPIVSTDSEDIITYCKEKNINYFIESVDDSSMLNCVKQVLNGFGLEKAHNIAILQPTSPMRKPGLLRESVKKMEGENKHTAISVTPYKIIGELGGEFKFATRDQDPKTKFFNFFDGNVLVSRAEDIIKNDNLFTDQDPVYLKNDFPCNLQIDTNTEFEVVKGIMEGVTLQSYVPNIIRRKKIAVVANKCDLTRNYSKFIDSCDEVFRVNRANNLDTGLVGNRVDYWLVAAYFHYENFSPEAQHRNRLHDAKKVFFIPEIGGTGEKCAKEYGLTNWEWIPRKPHMETINQTTVIKTLAIAIELFPDAQIYFLGDFDSKVRAPSSTKHNPQKENILLDTWIKKGHVVMISEEEKKDNFIYSESITLRERWKTMDQCLLFGSEKELDETLTIVFPGAVDKLRVLKNRCCREMAPGATLGNIVKRTEEELLIHFDSMGYAKFKPKDLNGTMAWYLDIGKEYGTQQI